MTRERKRLSGELAAVQMAFLCKVLLGEDVDPEELNPYAEPGPEPPPKTEAQKHREHRAGWAALERMVFGKVVHERE
jgi:hypothetical protein